MKIRFLFSLLLLVAGAISTQASIITYMSDGQVYATVTQEDGEYYKVPEESPRFDDFYMCVFAGWSTTEDGTPQFINENSKVNGDITLYARFALGSFTKDFRYRRVTQAADITPDTDFVICAYDGGNAYALKWYAGWTYNYCQRGYSGARFKVADAYAESFQIDDYDHLYWVKHDGEGGLTCGNYDYTMCHGFGPNSSCDYFGFADGSRDSWGDLFGTKYFSVQHQSDGSFAIMNSSEKSCLKYFPNGYKPSGATDMGIYFAFEHFDSAPSKLYFYKKITEISTEGTFVSTSEHYNISFNVVDDPGVEFYVDGKEGNYAVGDMKSGFKCMKGYSGTFSYSFYSEPEANLIACWTTSDGRYTNYKGRSITLTPDEDITVTVTFVEVEKSIIINGEIIPVGNEPIELGKGEVVINGDEVILDGAYIDGTLGISFGDATLEVNGECTISGGLIANGNLTISGNGTLNIVAPTGLYSQGGVLTIDSSVTINIIPDEGGKKAPAKIGEKGGKDDEKGDKDDVYYPPFAIVGFDDVEISSDYFLIAPIKGYYDAKSQVFMTAEGMPAQSLRIIPRRTLDINGDGTLSIQDVNILIEALLSGELDKKPEKK